MRVLRAVGLMGEGEMGVLGMVGVLRDRLGREAWDAEVEMLRASLGLETRAVAASILAVWEVVFLGFLVFRLRSSFACREV